MIEMEFEGFDDLIKKVEKLADESTIEKTNKEILKECGIIAHDEAKRKMHVSKDVSKSGRKGSRTGQHAKDNIPISNIRKKNGNYYIVVGWEKIDTSPYFYEKFEEWGTSKHPPHVVFGLIYKTKFGIYNEIAKQKYEKLVNELERG